MKDSLIRRRKDICWIPASFLLTPHQGSDIARCKKASCVTPNTSLLRHLCILLLEVSKADLPFNPNPGVSHICGKLSDDVPLYVVLYPQAGGAWFSHDSMSRR